MNASKSSGGRRRAGFTLVELLVVIGLMALLGTISIGGYYAASRGMKTRGAVQDTISFIRHAQQVCLIDNTATAVLFLNRYTGRRKDGGEVYGTAIAIKMAGRISNIASSGKSIGGASPGAMLIDEFADWNTSYPHVAASTSDERGMRFYLMTDLKNRAKGGLSRCSSLMNDWVGYIRMSDKQGKEQLLATGMDTAEWCTLYKKNASDNRKNSAIDYDNGNDYRWGLGFHRKNKGLSASQWGIGDAYGTEIGTFDLPKGYIFGNKTPDDSGALEAAGGTAAVVFLPSQVSNDNDYKFPMETVTIYGIGLNGKADTPEKVGDIRSKDCEDQN